MLVGKAACFTSTDKRARKEVSVMLKHFLWCVYTNTKENMTFQEGLMLLIMQGLLAGKLIDKVTHLLTVFK